jgi:hypothetical protein
LVWLVFAQVGGDQPLLLLLKQGIGSAHGEQNGELVIQSSLKRLQTTVPAEGIALLQQRRQIGNRLPAHQIDAVLDPIGLELLEATTEAAMGREHGGGAIVLCAELLDGDAALEAAPIRLAIQDLQLQMEGPGEHGQDGEWEWAMVVVVPVLLWQPVHQA